MKFGQNHIWTKFGQKVVWTKGRSDKMKFGQNVSDKLWLDKLFSDSLHGSLTVSLKRIKSNGLNQNQYAKARPPLIGSSHFIKKVTYSKLSRFVPIVHYLPFLIGKGIFLPFLLLHVFTYFCRE